MKAVGGKGWVVYEMDREFRGGGSGGGGGGDGGGDVDERIVGQDGRLAGGGWRKGGEQGAGGTTLRCPP